MLSVRDIVGQPDWTRIPDDEPTSEDEGGPPDNRPPDTRTTEYPKYEIPCPECSGRGTTGMGPCSLCTPREPGLFCPECKSGEVDNLGDGNSLLCLRCDRTWEPESPPAILRRLPNGRLSLRLEVLSPEREVAELQVGDAWSVSAKSTIRDMQPGYLRPLRWALLDLRSAIHNHYPRTRHLEAVRAAFTEYVKSQEDSQ